MKRGLMISLICFSLFFINASITVQAEGEGIPTDAVVCAIPKGATEDSSEVKYFKNIEDAFDNENVEMQKMLSEKCTIKLLKDTSTASQLDMISDDFTFDLNGKTLSANSETGSCISVQDSSIYFKDSSSEKTGTVIGPASAISIFFNGKVTIESGNYVADSWGIITTDTPDTQVELKITGGCFKGNVGVQTSIGTNYEISGGEFYGRQNSVNNNGTMKITDGTFFGEIYNAAGAVLDFQTGTVIVSENSSHAYAGIQNQGTLNLRGGNVFAAEDAKKPMKGILNGKNATLNLYDDVNFQKVQTDFQLEKAMNICGTLENTYRVTMSVLEDGEGVVFAEVKPGGSLSKATFIAGETGRVVDVSDDGKSLSLSKCAHKNLNQVYTCEACGVQMYACIGDTYYLSLADAFDAVKNAGIEEKKTVKVLRDISEDENDNLNISGGTFSLDFNGHTIEGTLNVNGGNVTLVGNGGTLNGLFIQENAYVEMSGLTIEGDSPVLNHGTFRMADGKIDGGQMAIINFAGNAYLDGGEILAEKIAVMNYGGTVTVGTERGTGPVIKAPVGILNSKYLSQDIDKDADLVIRGGEITAETDIYNKSGEYQLGSADSGEGSLPLTAGTVTLQGGTFVNGLRVAVDEGVGFEDILAKDYWYYDSNDKKFSVDANTNELLIDETVTVQKPAEAEDEDQDFDDSTDKAEDQDADDSTDKAEDQDFDESTGKETGTVKTGDSVNVGIWIVGLFISGAVLNEKRKHKL